MAGEAEQLEILAAQLDEERLRVEDGLRRMMTQAEGEIVQSPLGWKGPSADRFWNESLEEQSRLRAALERLAQMTAQMRQAANEARASENQTPGSPSA